MQDRLGAGVSIEETQTERLNALRRVESQISELERMEQTKSATARGGPGAGQRLVQPPRSANLEQLYHEAIPMDKALSHSGPSAFGNGLLQHPTVSLQIFSKVAQRLQRSNYESSLLRLPR